MAIKPILFNTDMVRAILDGQKTQTRRVIKLGKGFSGRQVGECGNPEKPLGFWYPCGIKRPPYDKGDILWVRETWCPYANIDSFFDGINRYAYKADHEDDFIQAHKWHPSIHMPREAARIYLRVTFVCVERLRDISFEDCKAEGIWDDYNTPSYIYHENLQRVAYPVVFKELWNRTIKKSDLPKYGWDANPWVWVIEFERCEKPEAGL